MAALSIQVLPLCIFIIFINFTTCVLWVNILNCIITVSMQKTGRKRQE